MQENPLTSRPFCSNKAESNEWEPQQHCRGRPGGPQHPPTHCWAGSQHSRIGGAFLSEGLVGHWWLRGGNPSPLAQHTPRCLPGSHHTTPAPRPRARPSPARAPPATPPGAPASHPTRCSTVTSHPRWCPTSHPSWCPCPPPPPQTPLHLLCWSGGGRFYRGQHVRSKCMARAACCRVDAGSLNTIENMPSLFFFVVRSEINGRVFIQSWGWDPPKLSRKIPSFSQNDFGNFLSGAYRNRSSGIPTAGVGISAQDAQTPFFLGFLVSTADFGFGALRWKLSYFPEMPVTQFWVSAPAPQKTATVREGLVRMAMCLPNRIPCMHASAKEKMIYIYIYVVGFQEIVGKFGSFVGLVGRQVWGKGGDSNFMFTSKAVEPHRYRTEEGIWWSKSQVRCASTNTSLTKHILSRDLGEGENIS